MLKYVALLSSLLLAAGGPVIAQEGSSPAPEPTAPGSVPPAIAIDAPASADAGSPSTLVTSEAAFQFARAKLLAAERAYPEAIRAFEEAIRLNPDDPYLRIEFAELLFDPNRPLRDLAARQRQLGQAVEQVLEARRLAPENLDVLRTVGRVHMMMSGYDPDAAEVALEAYRKIRRQEPWDVQSMVALGQILGERGEFGEAAEIFEEASRYTPNNRIIFTFLADAQERAGNSEAAAAALARILDLDPSDVDTRIRLAELVGRQGDHEEALAVLEEAVSGQERDPRLRYLRARELFFLDRAEEALSLTEELLEENPGRRLQRFVTDLRARALASVGRTDEAFRELARLLDLDPGNTDLVRQVAAQLTAGAPPEEAREMLSAFIERHRARALEEEEVARSLEAARVALTGIYVSQEEWDLAVAVLEPLLESERETLRVNGLLHLAEVLHLSGRPGEAQRLLKKNHDEVPEATAKRVQLFLLSEEPGKARKLLRKAAREHSLESSLGAVQAFHGEELWEETLEPLEQITERHPRSLPAHFMLGSARERSGDVEGAARAFRAALEIEPDDPQTLNYLGYMWADRGENLEQALKMIRRAVQQDADNGAYVDSLGWVLYRLGQYAEAREHLERAARLASGDPVVLEHLGDVYVALGEDGKAAEIYRRILQAAAELGEGDQDLGAVQRKLDELTVD